MDWIRKNPHLVVLIAVAVAAAAASGLVATNAKDFNERFSEVQQQAPESSKIPPVNQERLETARKELEKPAQWVSRVGADGSPIFPFVPFLYYIKDGKPERFGKGSTHPHSITNDPIPDVWYMSNNLPVTDTDVGLQDPDGDGFNNEDEWLGKTDPKDKLSHPPYVSKLYFRSIERVPFRLRFNGYDGDPSRDKVADMSFQINTLDLKQPTEFKKLGEMVPRTPYKLEKFEFKQALNEKIGEKEEVSELTLMNTETGIPVVLILNKIVNSPDEYAHFWYTWPKAPQEIRVKRAGKFILLPMKDEFYLIVDIKDNEALIKTPAGAEVKIVAPPPKLGLPK